MAVITIQVKEGGPIAALFDWLASLLKSMTSVLTHFFLGIACMTLIGGLTVVAVENNWSGLDRFMTIVLGVIIFPKAIVNGLHNSVELDANSGTLLLLTWVGIFQSIRWAVERVTGRRLFPDPKPGYLSLAAILIAGYAVLLPLLIYSYRQDQQQAWLIFFSLACAALIAGLANMLVLYHARKALRNNPAFRSSIH